MENTDNSMDLHSACKKHLAYLTYRVPSMCYHYSESHTQIHPLETIAGHLAEPVEPTCQRPDELQELVSPILLLVGMGFEKLLCGLLTSCHSLYHHGEEGGRHQMQLCHNHHCVSQRQGRTHSTADAGGHTSTGKLLCSQKTQSQEKVGKNTYCPHSKSQYLCLVKPRLKPHDQRLYDQPL